MNPNYLLNQKKVSKNKKYDMLIIGLGPAGMSLAAMGSAMGLNVLGIEKRRVGGECLNCGCIPSKSILKKAEINKLATKGDNYRLDSSVASCDNELFEKIQGEVDYIVEKKTMGMFDAVDILHDEAKFVDNKTVEVAGETYTAKRIYICTGTKPRIPDVKGANELDSLTNENMFEQENIPETMFIYGGGAIAVEMAQAFSRLGSKVIMGYRSEILKAADRDVIDVLEESLKEEGIILKSNFSVTEFKKTDKKTIVKTDSEEFEVDKVLFAIGRVPNINRLNLESTDIKYNNREIITNDYGETNVKNVFAIGDTNGKDLYSHAAMHQGMLTLINNMVFGPFKQKFKNYVVPWSVFTDPEVAHVGKTEQELKAEGKKYQVIKAKYEDYGRTITDGKTKGFVKVMVTKWGKILGVSIVGAQASELIHEYILAMHKNIRLHDILLMQHSFPTISLLNKRVAEQWMMKMVKTTSWMRRMGQFLFRI